MVARQAQSKYYFLILLSVWLPLAAARPAAADDGDWPQFLGPSRNGISPATGLNVDWETRPPKTLWKVPLGKGFSSLAVVGGEVFTMANRGARDVVCCYRADSGREKWSVDASPRYLDTQGQGPGPRATPTFDDGLLYCLLPAGDLLCLAADDGGEVWKINVFAATGAENHEGGLYWGLSGSPLVEGDLVIVQPGGDNSNSVAAFDKRTGKLIWSAGDDLPGYGAPIAVSVAGRRQVICLTGTGALAVDPFRGDVLWRFPWSNSFHCNCATPIWTDKGLFVSSAYGTGSALVEIVERKGEPAARHRWKGKQFQNQFTTSVVVDGYLYGCHGDIAACALRCVDLANGKQRWTEREPAKCQLLAAQGHLICLSEDGTLRLIEATPKKYLMKGESPALLAPRCWTPPALAGKRLYVRDEQDLLCLDLSGTPAD
ncbi:MAG TPA: PQQ-binding-like beta-propeller repeat protein [Pirellulales bacterium]|nr:PQQ-binding-like beta-propeller repeat protein [Pirellulales bacterium]